MAALYRRVTILCILLLNVSIITQAVSPQDHNIQWSGFCQESCGKLLHLYCGQDGRCYHCAVYCLPTQDFFDDEKCRQICPAFWASSHLSTTGTPELDTSPATSVRHQTTQTKTISLDTTPFVNNTSVSQKPLPTILQAKVASASTAIGNDTVWWYVGIGVAIFWVLCLCIAVFSLYTCVRYRYRKNNEDVEHGSGPGSGHTDVVRDGLGDYRPVSNNMNNEVDQQENQEVVQFDEEEGRSISRTDQTGRIGTPYPVQVEATDIPMKVSSV